jgi:hypothetical protein
MVIFSVLSFCVCAQDEVPSFGEKARPWVEKMLGEEWAIKLLGPKAEVIELPPIPKIISDSKSTAVYDKKIAEKKSTLTKEEDQKLNYYFIKELYGAVRGVEPQGEELNRWLNALDQGGTREGVYRALVLDDQYVGLENYNKAPTREVVQFIDWYFPRFLGKKFNKAEKINFFTLKRETVEKSLEVVDALGTNLDLLSSWYAVLSAELAEKYPQAFKIDLRKSVDKKRHKLWAQSSPQQHLKSELMIKIHTVLNLLGGV